MTIDPKYILKSFFLVKKRPPNERYLGIDKFNHILSKSIFIRKFHSVNSNKHWRSYLRIGPHNRDVLSLFIGSILGDTHLKKGKKEIGTTIRFEQCKCNVKYIMWYHNFLFIRGYCCLNKHKLITIIKKKNKTLFQYKITSFNFTSLNWLYNMFYINNKKIVPKNLINYLTPLALSIWFMYDKNNLAKGAKTITNCFSKDDLKYLALLLNNKYNLNVILCNLKKEESYILYIKSSDMLVFNSIAQ